MGNFSINLIDALMSIGISRDRAYSLAELFERGIDERYSLHAQVLATKRDLSELELKITREITREINQTNERISQVELSLRTDINATRLAIADSKTEIIKWMIGSIVALGGLLIAVIRLSV